jgi:uncharacterized protein
MNDYTYTDLNIKLVRNIKTSDITIDVEIEAIKNSVRNILQCKKMERRMLPDFGTMLERLLFEPIDNDTSNQIGEIILNELSFWEPRIRVNNINILPDEDNLKYNIGISYTILSLSKNDKIEFSLLTS